MIDLIIIIMAGIVLLFLLSCCFMVARLLDEEISMYGYEGKENWEREQLPDKLSRSTLLSIRKSHSANYDFFPALFILF